MLDKRKRGGLWLVWVALTNVGFVLYLQTYISAGSGGFVFGLPEAFAILVAFVFVVTGGNAILAWYYLGKPNVSELYTPRSTEGTEAPEAVDPSAGADTTRMEESR